MQKFHFRVTIQKFVAILVENQQIPWELCRRTCVEWLKSPKPSEKSTRNWNRFEKKWAISSEKIGIGAATIGTVPSGNLT